MKRATAAEVDSILTDEFLREEATKSEFYTKNNFPSFARGVRRAVRALLSSTSNHKIRGEIEALRTAATASSDEALRRALTGMSIDTKALLDSRAYQIFNEDRVEPQHYDQRGNPIRHRRSKLTSENMTWVKLPELDDLLDAKKREAAFQMVLNLTTNGWRIVEGRLRSETTGDEVFRQRTSRTVEWLLDATTVGRGRQRNLSARDFVAFTLISHVQAFGKEPACTSNYNIPSEYSRFLQVVLQRIGVNDFSVIETLNAVQRERKVASASKSQFEDSSN